VSLGLFRVRRASSVFPEGLPAAAHDLCIGVAGDHPRRLSSQARAGQVTFFSREFHETD
jgi:hypothetical protein